MIELSHIYGRLALAFGALLIPMALVSAPAHADGTPVRVRGSVVSLRPCDQWKSSCSLIVCAGPPKATILGTSAHQA